LEVCPTHAISRDDEEGLVKIDADFCIGCKLCVYACPFGGMALLHGVAAKCDYCGGNPTCVEVCPRKALEFIESDRIGIERKRAGIRRLVELIELTTEKPDRQ
jgi:Fe-S-cluster-containing hydrogenase component 2